MAERSNVDPGEGPAGPEASLSVSSFELIAQAKLGDRAALNALCERYLPLLHRWARGRLPSDARRLLETDDIVHDTVIGTVENLSSFEYAREGALLAYMRTALHNRVRREARNLGRRPAPAEFDEERAGPSGHSPLDDVIGREGLERYDAALLRLSEADRAAIVARVEMGLPYLELVDALGKPTQTAARMAVSRAMVRLAREMADESW